MQLQLGASPWGARVARTCCMFRRCGMPCGCCIRRDASSPPSMPPKKRQRGQQQALTEAQRAERVCSICEVPVPGAFTWLDPDTQQPCYGSNGCIICAARTGVRVWEGPGAARASCSAPAQSTQPKPAAAIQQHGTTAPDQHDMSQPASLYSVRPGRPDAGASGSLRGRSQASPVNTTTNGPQCPAMPTGARGRAHSHTG
jgi:hypothetical protein